MKRYPIGIQDFAKLRTGADFYYVDKTAYIREIVSSPGNYFLSRPRRFGKSLLLSTLRYYFEGRRELFKGLAIDTDDVDWQPRPIIQYTFTGTDFSTEEGLNNAIEVFLNRYEKIYGRDESAIGFGVRMENILAKAHEQTGREAVVLIDEYDKPLLDAFGTEREERFREILGTLYVGLKNADQHEYLVLVTGVTKFSQVSLFSGANQLDDISMMEKYAAICGVTTEELKETFKESIETLAAERGTTPEQVLDKLKEMYDGYHFTARCPDIYNPYGLINCFNRNEYGTFWFQTSTPTSLIEAMPGDGAMQIEEWTKEYYPAQRFAEYKATREDVLPLLYQSGYLTIKEAKTVNDTTKFRLGFPNKEVRTGFASVIFGNYTKWKIDGRTWTLRLQEAVYDADTLKIRNLFVSYFASIPYSLHPVKDADDEMGGRPMERFFHYTMFLIFNLTTGYINIAEKQNARGRADFIVETDQHVYIFEFKMDRPAKSGAKQIKDRGYDLPYAADHRTLHRFAVAFNSKDCTIRQWLTDGVEEEEED